MAPRVEVAPGSSFAYHDLGHGGEAAGAGEHLAGDAGSEDGGHGAFARSAIGGMTSGIGPEPLDRVSAKK